MKIIKILALVSLFLNGCEVSIDKFKNQKPQLYPDYTIVFPEQKNKPDTFNHIKGTPYSKWIWE